MPPELRNAALQVYANEKIITKYKSNPYKFKILP